MSTGKPLRVGYVLKRYPRYSETFVVNEILAQEAGGLQIDVFALGPSDDTHFQDSISRVRAPLMYLRAEGLRGADFWEGIGAAAERLPGIYAALADARGEPARDVYQAAALAKMVAAKGIDLLHAHFATSAANVARLAARFAGIPFTMTAHAKDIFHREVSEADLRRKLRAAAATVTVSEYNLAHLRAAHGADAARAVRVYNGLDLTRFAYRPAIDRPRRVVAVGRLVEKKGFDVLARAAAILKRWGEEFSCQIVGEGEQDQALRELVHELGVEDRVELAGPRPQAELVSLMQSAAVLAAPCVIGADGNRDGLPTVLLEAMALGTPCVSTDVTGIPEVVRHERTGLVVPQRDAEALARAIRGVLAQPRMAGELAARARELIEAEFDVRRTSAELRRVFERAVGAAGRGGEA
jgi:glycosyltransferase involved in cell wall biosynthesis